MCSIFSVDAPARSLSMVRQFSCSLRIDAGLFALLSVPRFPVAELELSLFWSKFEAAGGAPVAPATGAIATALRK
jgi:hypothetical protein